MEECHHSDDNSTFKIAEEEEPSTRQLFFKAMKTYYIQAEKNEQELISKIEQLESSTSLKRAFPFTSANEIVREKKIDQDSIHIKYLMVGGSDVGKTTFMYHLSLNMDPPYSNVASHLEYTPTIHDGFSAEKHIGGSVCHIGFWDTPGNLDDSQYSLLRPISYVGADVCFLCFDCMDYQSLLVAINNFYTELRNHMDKEEGEDFPIALLSTKQDMKQDRKQVLKLLISKKEKPISRQLGERVAKALGCVTYLESIVLPAQDYYVAIANISRMKGLEFKNEKSIKNSEQEPKSGFLQKLGRLFRK